MLYFWIFLALSILCVSCYIWQVMGAAASISAFLGTYHPYGINLLFYYAIDQR